MTGLEKSFFVVKNKYNEIKMSYIKNYKQILEAINRGIKFALDDFEDQEDIQGQISSKVNHNHGTKEYLDLMNNVVDLGLPSGTLWCKYNLDVDPNQLSKPEDWHGGYYAWGEIEPNKPIYNWETYKFGKDYNKLTKYCNNYNYGLYSRIDNVTKLLPEDDAAYQNKKLYNYKFHMPTKEQFEELLAYTSNYWVKNYDPNKTLHNFKNDKGIQGLNGYIFEGKNGNQLFISANGYCLDSDINIVGSNCYLWSSSLYLDNPAGACGLNCYSSNINIRYYDRNVGFSVRPVINL